MNIPAFPVKALDTVDEDVWHSILSFASEKEWMRLQQ